jgi:hypothetical protein
MFFVVNDVPLELLGFPAPKRVPIEAMVVVPHAPTFLGNGVSPAAAAPDESEQAVNAAK